MATLYRKGLKKTILFEECASQDLLEDPPYARIWEGFLLTRMRELEERHSFRVPWMKELQSITELKVRAAIILNKVRDGIKDVEEIEQQTGIPKDEIMAYVDHLEMEGLILIDRSRHPHGRTIIPRNLNFHV